jgi:nodulation protein A
MTEPRWSCVWEDDLPADAHRELAALLRRGFPRSRAGFPDATSWASARPELRLVGYRDDRPVAHLGILRRIVQVGSGSLLIGDVGLVAVDPDLQGSGLGARLLGRAAAVLDRLELPFGFLTCGEHVAGFYAAGGWVRVPNPVRMIRADGRVQVYGGVAMALAVRAPIEAWPQTGRLDRNGYEV